MMSRLHFTVNIIFILWAMVELAFSKRILRTGSQYSDLEFYSKSSDSDEDQLIAIAIVDGKSNSNLRMPPENTKINLKHVKPTLKDNSSSSDSDDYDDTNDLDFGGLNLNQQQKSLLRKKWRSSCDKKAAKQCKKACIKARKNVCDSYHCKKSLAKRFKKECKRTCRSYFVGSGKYSSSNE